MEDDLSSIAPLRARITRVERGIADVLQHLTALSAENARLQTALGELRQRLDARSDSAVGGAIGAAAPVERPRPDGRREARLE